MHVVSISKKIVLKRLVFIFFFSALFASLCPSGLVIAYLEYPTNSSGISTETGLPVVCPDSHPIAGAVADYVRGNFITCTSVAEWCGANPSSSRCDSATTTTTTTTIVGGGSSGGQTENTLAQYPMSNPFPGVAFGGEVPGYTVSVSCSPGGDCGIGIVPVINCPTWSAADGQDGYVSGVAKRFCRASWLPPTTSADEQDFTDRQSLAIAAATLESQKWNAAHPGQQKCVQWGPVVHRNGVGTASGGVCANPFLTESGESTSGGNSKTEKIPETSQEKSIDLSNYGIGKPFTKVISGKHTVDECPAGYRAAVNDIAGISSGATECWPGDAFDAWNRGGKLWASFKSVNTTSQIVEEQKSTTATNRLRAIALVQAQQDATAQVGTVSCVKWDYNGTSSGQECAFIPTQSRVGIGSSSGAKEAQIALKGTSTSSDSVNEGTSGVISGKHSEIKDAIALVADDTAKEISINNLFTKVENMSESIKKNGAQLPNNKSLDVEIESLTTRQCKVKGTKLIVVKTGMCTIEYTISENEVDFVVDQKFKVKK